MVGDLVHKKLIRAYVYCYPTKDETFCICISSIFSSVFPKLNHFQFTETEILVNFSDKKKMFDICPSCMFVNCTNSQLLHQNYYMKSPQTYHTVIYRGPEAVMHLF